MTLDQKFVAKRIELIMNRLGVNQAKLAELLGVTQPAVSKYLRDRVPPAAVLLDLAHISGTSIEWILTGMEKIKPRGVAEPLASYREGEIATKIRRLPENLQNQVGKLVDEMLLSLEDGLS